MLRTIMLFAAVCLSAHLWADTADAQVRGGRLGTRNGNRSNMYAPGTQMVPGTNISTAHFQVMVPQSATIYFDGKQMPMTAQTPMTGQMPRTGTVRDYLSPPLEPGYEYTFQVRATWQENGETVTRTRRVSFQPGQDVMVNFNDTPIPPLGN